MIVKKFIFDQDEFFEIPNREINYKSLIIEIKFVCFESLIWKSLQESFNKNYLKIDNLYCSSYIRSSSYNSLFGDFNKKYKDNKTKKDWLSRDEKVRKSVQRWPKLGREIDPSITKIVSKKKTRHPRGRTSPDHLAKAEWTKKLRLRYED